MNYETLLRQRRSIREFEERDISLDLVMEIIRDSCLAPSAMNGQPWRFVVINNRRWIKRISDESKKNHLRDLEKNPFSPLNRYEDRFRDEAFNVFYNAPCLVFIAGPCNVLSVAVDCTLAAAYFMFAATARGLGTCWVGLGSNISDPEMLEAIGIPGDCRIIAPLILGYPLSIPEPRDREVPKVIKILR